MKKILSIMLAIYIMILIPMPSYSLSVGTYQTETEYGLLDGFKINWKNKDKNKPFIEPREQSTKKEKETEYKQYKESEYERTKYMYEGWSVL